MFHPAGFATSTSNKYPVSSDEYPENAYCHLLRNIRKNHLTDIFMLHFIENTGIFWLIFLLAGISLKEKQSWYIYC